MDAKKPGARSSEQRSDKGAGADARPVVLARLGKPHGLAGENRVILYNESSELLFELEEVLALGPDGSSQVTTIEHIRRGPGGSLLLRLDGCRSRNDAEQLRGKELAVKRAALPEPAEGEWYHHDLVGLEVRDHSANRVGRVDRVLAYPSVDCLAVQLEEGTVEVPMVEPWLEAIDLDAGFVVVNQLEELPVVPDPEGRREP